MDYGPQGHPGTDGPPGFYMIDLQQHCTHCGGKHRITDENGGTIAWSRDWCQGFKDETNQHKLDLVRSLASSAIEILREIQLSDSPPERHVLLRAQADALFRKDA